MIFPEGRVTRTCGLMKIYEGPGLIADRAGAVVLPLRIDGAQYTFFTDLKGKMPRRLFPKITLTLLPPRRLHLPETSKGRERRQLAVEQIHDFMEALIVESNPVDTTLLKSLLNARDLHGGGKVIIEDKRRKPLTYNQFIAKIFTLSRAIHRLVAKQEKSIGIMMPNMIETAVAIFAIQALNRVTAMINFTSGTVRIVGISKLAQLKTVLTLRAFIEGEKLTPVTDALQAAGVKIIYLEDMLPQIGLMDKSIGVLKTMLPTRWATLGLASQSDDPALLLFTSGTEGSPKGVALSHKNILANCAQMVARVAICPHDSAFACLPMFHSFGLTLGVFLELFYGIRTLLYPSPLRYHEIPELVYDCGATLMLGTDTFLAGYAHNAHPHDFHFMRYVVAGAEKLKPETRRLWAEKLGVRLLEGYGATETSPVLSVNSPLHHKAGTIGKILSGIEVRLNPVPGIKDGATLIVKGPNIMLGYIKEDRPGVVQPLQDGWYDTGDVVSVDEEGYITILGRTKRFAKIGGEMVSLAAVETVVTTLWPEHRHAAVSVPHARKGEMVVLLTDNNEATLDMLPDHFRLHGLTELSLPRRLIKVAQLPLLGSGKVDYVKAGQLAIEEVGGD
jgi:acyl-[acyl-carrier-protein]-phospholipid O-acyltransferase/long-chain-fatty-acid--[acyl-carrier-protein] ligase